MNWGTMYLRWNQSVRVRSRVAIALLGGLSLLISLTALGSPYSASELRAVESSNEAQIRELREQEVKQLRIALGRRSPQKRLADLYFRLAEIYLEAYRAEFLLEGRAHEQRLKGGMADPFIDRSYSKPSLYNGIKASQAILNFRIPYGRMDEVFYFLGFNYGELGDRRQSAAYFSRLVEHYPNSQFAGVAYKELAEFHFKAKEFEKAVHFFESAIQKTQKERIPPLLHRLAWSYYKTRQYDRAVAAMKEVIRIAGERFGPIRDEALMDLATLMAERGQVEEAVRYFSEVAGDKQAFPKILEKLARQYERNVEWDKAVQVYERLLSIETNPNKRFIIQVKLIEVDLKHTQFQRVVKRVKAAEIPKDLSEEAKVEEQNLRVMIRKAATSHHQLANKGLSKNKNADLQLAEAFYQCYLNPILSASDPHHETQEIRMYLAEVFKDLGQKKEVALLYGKVVRSQDPKYAKEAAKLWISSLFEALKLLKGASHSLASGPSEIEKEFIEAADTLAESLGQTKEAPEVALRAAQIQAGYSASLSDGIRRIDQIVEKWPDSPQALVATQLRLQLIMDHESKGSLSESAMEALEKLIGSLRAIPRVLENDRRNNKGKIGAYLSQLEERMRVSRISHFEAKKDYASAIKGYLAFAEKERDQSVAEKAFENALFGALKTVSSSSSTANFEIPPILWEVKEAWSKKYPRSPKALGPLRTVATNSFIRGDFEAAIKLFSGIGMDYSDGPSLEFVARIYEAIGKQDLAQATWKTYLERFKTSERRWEVSLLLAKSLDRSGLESEASSTYRYCSERGSPLVEECTFHLADLYLKNKDPEQAKKYFRMIAGAVPVQKKKQKASRESASPFVGYALYRIAELQEQEAHFDPLKFPEAELQKALGQRLSFLEPLSKAYQSSVLVGGPWAIASLHRLALWVTHFADEVDRIEPPSSLQGPALEKFRRDLGSISKPLREKAKSTWTECYQKASSFGILSPVLPDVADHLADERVIPPARAQGARGHFHLDGIRPKGGTPEHEEQMRKVREKLLAHAQDASSWVVYGNLFWTSGRTGLARLAYERALSIQPKQVDALNNLAVVLLGEEELDKPSADGQSIGGEEDWMTVVQATQFLGQALGVDDFYAPAKLNLGTLYNYYRLFSKSRPLWDQVLVRNLAGDLIADARDGLGVALAGLGNATVAESSFKKATEGGASAERFASLYHQAAASSTSKPDQCVSSVESLEKLQLKGFEASSASYLKERCRQWAKK